MTDPEVAAVEAAAARAQARLRVHGGRVGVRHVDGGEVTVAFGGFCAGCPSRPLCHVATVEPELHAVPGVTAVHAVGVRLDDDTRRRLDTFLGR